MPPHCKAMHLPGINRQNVHTSHSSNSSCGVRKQKALVYEAIISSIWIGLHRIETKFTASDVLEVDSRKTFFCLVGSGINKIADFLNRWFHS